MMRERMLTVLMAFTMLVSATAGLMTVAAQAANSPPDILSEPEEWAWAGETYEYQVLAVDIDEDPLNYSLWVRPEGMTIDTKGLVTWTPTDDQTGEQHIVGIAVTDPSGAKATQNYTIWVEEIPPPYVDIWFPYWGTEVSGTITINGMVYSGWWDEKDPDGQSDPMFFNLTLEIMTGDNLVVWTHTMVVESSYEPYRETNFAVDFDTTKFADGEYTLRATAVDQRGKVGTYELMFKINNKHDGEVVWFTYPSEGTTVKGYIDIKGGASKEKKVDKVQLRIDDSFEGTMVLDWTTVNGVTEWYYGFNFTGLGVCFDLSARALVGGETVGKAKVTVCTDNIQPPPPPPPQEIKAWFETPSWDETVKDTVSVSIGMFGEDVKMYRGELTIYSDDSGIGVAMSFEAQGDPGQEAFYEFSWDTTEFPDGYAMLEVSLYDEMGRFGYAELEVYISNEGTTPPPPPPPPPKEFEIKFTSPAGGATVKGTIKVTGMVYYTENVRTLTIDIEMDGDEYTTILSTGGSWQEWTFQVDTTKLSEGKHTITAVVGFISNSASATLEIVVDNDGTSPPPPPPPPPIVPDGEVKDGKIVHDGKEVDFTSPSYPGMDQDNMNYTWDFGDGTYSHEKDPTHKYNKDGEYKVKLTVTDGSSTQEEEATLDVGSPRIKTTTPGFGAPLMILGLTAGALVAFFRGRK